MNAVFYKISNSIRAISPSMRENCFVCFCLCHVALWDLNFLTRDQSQVTVVKVPSPDHWIAREFSKIAFL